MRPDETHAIQPASQVLARSRLFFVPAEVSHVKHVRSRMRARLYKGDLDDAATAALVVGPARTAMLSGEPVACGGLIDEKEGRARAWALIGEKLPRSGWLDVIAEMRAGIEQALHPETGWAHRVWAETVYDWPDGHKLLLHLGMALEGLNRGAFAGGKHGATYARVRGDVGALPVRWRALVATAERCLWEDALNLPMPYRREAA